MRLLLLCYACLFSLVLTGQSSNPLNYPPNPDPNLCYVFCIDDQGNIADEAIPTICDLFTLNYEVVYESLHSLGLVAESLEVYEQYHNRKELVVLMKKVINPSLKEGIVGLNDEGSISKEALTEIGIEYVANRKPKRSLKLMKAKRKRKR